jgi:gliding motility-associated-like protein
MKKSCSFFLFFFVLFNVYLIGNVSAQIATYPLRTGGGNPTGGTALTSATNANVTASAITVGAEITSTPAGTYNSSGLRVKLNTAASWPSAATNAYHIDVPISPKTNYDFTLTSVTFKDSVNENSPNFRFALAYQRNGTGAWNFIGTPVNVSTANTVYSFSGLNESFYSGNTYVFRLYVYGVGSQDKNQAFRMVSLVFNGTASTPAAIAPLVTTGVLGTATKYSNTVSNSFYNISVSPLNYRTVKESGVCWNTVGTPTIANSKTTDVATAGAGSASFNSSITGLSPSTKYYVKAYAITQLDTIYGTEQSFTTLAPSIPIVTTNAVTNVLSTKASSGGVITDSGGVKITAKGVCWSTSPAPTVANSKTNDGNASSAFTSQIKILLPNTTYYARAYATNSIGTAYGNEVSFTTSTAVPVINASPVSLNFGNEIKAAAPTLLSYSLSASNLAPNIGSLTITPPSGFAISTSNTSGFVTTPLTVPYSGGQLAATTIFVKMLTTSFGVFSGNILHSGGGAANPNIDTVAVNGAVVQDPNVLTNVGTDFWVGYGLEEKMSSKVGSPVIYGLQLYVATGAQASTIKVSIPGIPSFTPLTYTIPANSVQIVSGFPTGDANDAKNAAGLPDSRLYYTGVVDRGIHVEVTNNVPVAVFLYDYATNNSAGGSMVFPTNTWNSSYIVQTYGGAKSNTGIPNAYFFVIAKEDNTVVTFTPTNPILDSASSPVITGNPGGTTKYAAGIPQQVTLNKGQIFNAVGLVDATTEVSYDLTGTTVTTDCSKQIAVFAGNSRTLINATGNNCTSNSGSDNLIQQMFPKVAWGTKYLTVPTKTMEYNLFRIGVQDVNTIVKVDGVVLAKTASTWNATGLYYQIEGNKLRKIESDIPVTVTQFILPGTSCGGASVGNGGTGDPEMILLSPVQQSITSTTVYSSDFKSTSTITPNVNSGTYINVVIPKAGVSSFKLNAATNINQMVDTGQSSYSGNPYGVATLIPIARAFRVHPQDTNYYWAKFKVSYPATHTLSSDVGFNAIAYGVANGESWGYNAGTAIKDLSAVVTTTTPFGSAPSATTCKGNTTGLQISLPYPPSKMTGLQWISTDDPSVTPANDTASNMLPVTSTGSFVKDGVTYYTYPSPKNYTFDSVGTFKFVVTAFGTFTSECGGSKVFNVIMTVVKDTADFSFAPVSCGSLQYNFTDLTKPSIGDTITKWSWKFQVGDGLTTDTSTFQNASYTFPSKKIYNIKLRAINNIGCFSDTTKILDLTGGIIAKIKAVPDTLCLGTNTTFDASASTSSLGTIATYYWDFKDGKKDTTTVPTISHTYAAVGTYKPTLIVATAAGCTSNADTATVYVAPIPVADFKLPAGVCLPGNTTFINQSDSVVSGKLTYLWNFGDGIGTSTASNPVYAYAAAPPTAGYNVSLVATSAFGCVSKTVSKVVTDVYDKPQAIFTADLKTCFGDSTKFTDASTANNQTITNWYWDFGDATSSTLQNPKHKYTSVATFSARLVITTNKGCISDTSAAVLVKINPLPTPGFILPGSCLGSGTVTFTDTSSITPNDGTQLPFTYAWSFGDPTSASNTSTAQNGQHTYTAPGLYQVIQKVTSQNGCFASDTIPFDVAGSKPKPAFVVSNSANLCSNVSVQIQDTSRIDIGTIKKVEIIWDLTNNPTTIQTDATPSNGVAGSSKTYTHAYPVLSVDKTYTIQLTAYSGSTCLDVTTQTITVHGKPNVVFATQVGICADASARTITGATETAGLAGAFVYSGNGITGTQFDPKAATIGSNTIKAVYTTSFGCKDSATQTVNVWPLPTADFVYSAITCAKGTINFTDKSVAKIGNVATWAWNFGDANASTGNPNTASIAAPSHIYNVANTYTVGLTVSNDSGCVSTATKSIVVNQLPVASFKLPTSICLPNGNGTFTNTSTIPASSGTPSYLWDFGDPNNTSASTSVNPTHQFSAVRNYSVRLFVTTTDGCKHDTTIVLSQDTFHAAPIAVMALDKDNICLGATITATDKSTGTVSQSLWNFGDGTSTTGATATNKYRAAATYTVSHSIVDQYGCPSSAVTQAVVVNALPAINAGLDKYILSGRFDVIKAVVTGDSLSYKWLPSIAANYLDYDTVVNPICTPLTDITYTLRVTGKGGCVASDDVNVYILQVPKIPNVFTPNGDGTNDVWEIGYLAQYQGATVEVYNRYGQIVLQMQNGYTKPWDGKMNGQPLPVGTYYYIINPKNGLDKMAGSVTIIR